MKKGVGAGAYNFSDDDNNDNFKDEYIDDDFVENKKEQKKDFWEAPKPANNSKPNILGNKPSTLQQNNNFNNKQSSALALAGLQSLGPSKSNLPKGIIKDTPPSGVNKKNDDDDEGAYENGDYEDDDFDDDEEENFKVSKLKNFILIVENSCGFRETA